MAEQRVAGRCGALVAVTDHERGWLMYTDADDRWCFVSRDPAYTGDPRAVRRFRLDNGQQDAHPEAETLPRESIEDALTEFRSTGRLSSAVTWVDDFGSGQSPADAGL